MRVDFSSYVKNVGSSDYLVCECDSLLLVAALLRSYTVQMLVQTL